MGSFRENGTLLRKNFLGGNHIWGKGKIKGESLSGAVAQLVVGVTLGGKVSGSNLFTGK